MRWRRLCSTPPVLALGSCLLAASPARAHGSANLGDFYAGLTQPLFHPESMILLLALALWTGQPRREPQLQGLLAFAAGAVVGAGLGLIGAQVFPAAWLVRAGTLVLGLLTAIRWMPSLAAVVVVGGALGAAQGYVATYVDRAEIGRPILYILGVTLAPILVSSWFVALSSRFQADWIGIAFRVGGSWLAAIALMTTALALARP